MAGGPELPDRFPALDVRSVPHDRQLASLPSLQLSPEPHDIRIAKGPLPAAASKVAPPGSRQC